jgi:hypothetical protein
MDITYGELNLVIDGDQGKVPAWFFGLTEFAYGICSTREPLSLNSEHYVISLPDIDGGLAAVALGALAAEIERIETNSNFEEISLTQLQVGMKVSIDSGVNGQQKITGQVKTLDLEDRTPKIEIGSRWIAAKFIQKICLLPSEAGNPQIFQRKNIENKVARNFLEHLSSAALPIHRAILDIRSTTKIIEDELNWEFLCAGDLKSVKVKDSVKPISSGQPGSGWTLVLNSSESEDLAWENLGSYLNGSELDADVSVLCSGSAILAQLGGVNSRITFSILGRDDRQLAATELAIRQKYEYSNPLSRSIDSSKLGRGIELVAFEVPLNV